MIRRRPAATKTSRFAFRSCRRARFGAPPEDIIAGLRDRAILSVGLQVGRRRAEIAALKVGDLHRDPLAINPQTAARIRTISSLLYADRPRAKCVEEMKGANVPPIRRG